MARLTNRGVAPAEPDSPLPIPSFYTAESDEDVFSEIEQRPTDKPAPFNKDLLPFLQVGGRGFEILTFLLKQAEEPKDAVLTLVKASRDAGRDVLVHLNGRLRVVVQCKNLENRFALPSLLEELVKFVLYDYTERYISEDGITYEFWVPGGLTEPAERWLAEFPHSLTEEQLREAFDHVVQANKTLATLEWSEVSAYLRQTLTQRIRLNRHESISLTRKVKAAPDRLYEDFFQVTTVAPLSQVTDVIGAQLQARNDQLLTGFTDVVRGTQIDERINEARDLVNKREFRDAAIVLRQEETKNGHLFTDRQRFRLASNYGAIAFGENRMANLSESVQAGTKEFLAGLLMQLKRAADALPIFQELFDNDIPTFDARQLIACAAELRLHKKVLEICEELSRRRPPNWQMLEFEVQHLEQYDRDKAIQRLQEFLQREPGHKLAQLRLSITALLHGRRDLVRSAVSDLPAVENLPVNYIMAALGLLREGPNYQDAIDYAYR